MVTSVITPAAAGVRNLPAPPLPSVVGFCGLAAVHGIEYAELAMLDAGVSPAIVEAAMANVQPAIGIPMMATFLSRANTVAQCSLTASR